MKTRHRLFLSIGGGLIVAVLALLYLQSAEKKLHAQQKMTTVLVARRFIPAGKTVKADDVEARAVPEAYVQPLGVNTLKGTTVRARRGVAKGEQLTRSNVYEEGSLLGLSWTLAAGATAVSVQLAPPHAVGGHLLPGDRVDVLCVLDRQPGWEEAAAFSILSRVRVLAVNEKIVDAPGALAPADRTRELPNETMLVTLELPLALAARLALAEEKGRITLALTSPLDTETHSAPPLTLRGLRR